MEILNIQYTEKVIRMLKEHGIYADHLGTVYFILFALQEKKYKLLDCADDSSKARRMLILYRTMVRNNLLEVIDDNKYIYDLTEKGNKLVEKIRSEFDDVVVEAETFIQELPEVLKKAQLNLDIVDWIDEYTNLFPKKLQDHPKIAVARFKKHFDMFPEYKDKDIILGATKMYLDYQKESGKENFIVRSNYFIWKQVDRDKTNIQYNLASWCKQYQEKLENQGTNMDLSFLDTI